MDQEINIMILCVFWTAVHVPCFQVYSLFLLAYFQVVNVEYGICRNTILIQSFKGDGDCRFIERIPSKLSIQVGIPAHTSDHVKHCSLGGNFAISTQFVFNKLKINCVLIYIETSRRSFFYQNSSSVCIGTR